MLQKLTLSYQLCKLCKYMSYENYMSYGNYMSYVDYMSYVGYMIT